MDKNKNMLHALMGLEIGGAETHVVELVKELKNKGYNIIVASNGGVYENELEQAGIKHYKVPLNDRNPLNFIKSYFLLKHIIIKENIGFVHAHARIPSFICGLLQKKLKFTFVTTAHGVYFTGMGLKYITNWGQKVIAVSEDIKEYLMKDYHIKEENIFLTINGIDTNKFSPEIVAPEIKKEFNIKDEKVIVYVSRLNTEVVKIAWKLIACSEELSKRIKKLKIIIVGSGNEYNNMLKKINAINKKLGKDVIVMAGARTDINKIISICDLFIGVSRAALEAMAGEKPVIVAGKEGYIGLFDLSKLDNAIENNFTCRGNEQVSNDKFLKDIIYTLNLSNEKKKELGQIGRQVILDNFSISRMINDCQKAYEASLNIDYNNKKEVLILGYYGFGNWGDEATLSAIINMIRQTSAKTKINVLSYSGHETYETYKVNGISRNHANEIMSAIKRCDIVICGGGTILQDITSSRSLYYYLVIIWFAQKNHKKIVFFSNGFGPININKNKSITSKICNRANDIIVRDEKSKSMMIEMGINKKIQVSTDIVFNLEKKNNIMKQNKIAISLRAWKYSKKFTNDIAKTINKLIDKGYSIDLISLHKNKDEKVLNYIFERIDKKKYVSLYKGKNYRQVMNRIGEARIMIGMRLHANIFALINDVPIITINYDPKIEALAHDFEQPIIYTDDKNIYNKIIMSVKDIENNYEEKVEFIKHKTNEKRELLKINYDYLNKNL